MPTYPQGPRLLKGAIVAVDFLQSIPKVIVFQYNPESLSRSIQARTASGGAKSDALRLTGAPEETITLSVEIDAIDQLEKDEKEAREMGIYPQLSVLEMLLYPNTLQVIGNAALAASGTLEVTPMEAPMTLFIWGVRRILPVKVTSLTITENTHDLKLNPIRAKVDLSLRVLSYSDLSVTSFGYYAFLAHQTVKETMALTATMNNINAI